MKNKIECAELCAGIGGFRIGMEMSKLPVDIIYRNEIDNSCQKIYIENFNEEFTSKDIFDIVAKDVPDIDILCAGFPCQPFSQAGKRQGFQDDRGTIFFKIHEIVETKRPNIVFFENVPNLVRHNKGNTFNTIRYMLSELGYNVYYDILDSSYFGVPQSRPRVYIVAIKSNLSKKKFMFTKKKTERTPLRPYLNNGDYSIPISLKWQEYVDLYTNTKRLNELSFQPPKTRVALERIGAECDLKDCVFQLRTSGIRAYSLDASFPTFAVSNSGGGAMIPVLSKERRHLNLMEMKRIMGFPDNFKFPVSRTDAIKQLANAVCPPVVSSICDDIYYFLSNTDNNG
ncbi:DNA cytosine methyltransferase [Campylobacter sp. 7477a]|uniref:DNA cytosine methyltransferase n=1 Tax=Campylobacter sp. 7477a TaxID=2735741 RepID=UPI0030146628|nr:DNA cytosine methyltransferase [Campylobacter sp. 7477a]